MNIQAMRAKVFFFLNRKTIYKTAHRMKRREYEGTGLKAKKAGENYCKKCKAIKAKRITYMHTNIEAKPNAYVIKTC